MLFKRLLCMMIVALMCVSTGCAVNVGNDDPGGADGTDATEGRKPESYADHRAIYMERPLDVTVTLTVDMTPSVETRFSIKKEQEGYLLTDLGSDKKESYGDNEAEEMYKVAGYLPPYESAFDTGEGSYGVRFAGDLAIEMLLSGSNLFDGYGAEDVTLDGECVYSAAADYGIKNYSYDFSVTVSDGDVTFPAKVKYMIEVNE